MNSLKDYISTGEASKRYGLSTSHLARLLQTGIIKGAKIGHDWLVYEPVLREYVKKPPKPGPKRKKQET